MDINFCENVSLFLIFLNFVIIIIIILTYVNHTALMLDSSCFVDASRCTFMIWNHGVSFL